MSMYDRTNYYLEKAKELYKDVINDNPQSIYAKDSKMFMDKFWCDKVFKSYCCINKISRYWGDATKISFQELMNNKNDKKYELIFKTEKVYSKNINRYNKRFGYQKYNWNLRWN